MSRNHGQSVPISFSQNFLTSQKTIERLLKLTNICNNDLVVEIGAGKGHITKVLLHKSSQVIAFEIDAKLYASLRNKFADHQNLKLINRDFLRTNLPQTEYKVFSNIPFAITTDIIRKLTQDNNPPCETWLVLEKGAAKRLSGKPGDTLQSLLLKPFFDSNIIYHFRREDFHPAPRVDVVLLHISKKAVPDILPAEKKAYCDFITQGFKYGLSGKKSLLTKRQISTALRLAKLNPLSPGGEVMYVQWLCLFRCWLKYGLR
ncbi:23S ribosomal RNA methyltransferase Erm [Eubacteriales bacterium OttesenSCG-928-N13]|nr:23S ribosomal RNA methyltransferase Erm [Eubacteriales bacterium OttesenSCG-928-N13]